MDQKAFQKKARAFFAAAAVLALALLLYYAYQAYHFFRCLTPDYWSSLAVMWGSLTNVLLTALVLVIIVLAFRMLWCITRDMTPFSHANVRRLRVIGWLLLAFEPLQQLLSWIAVRMYNNTADGVRTVTHTSLGGVLLSVGLAVLCISVVFAYGCELQRQSDETL